MKKGLFISLLIACSQFGIAQMPICDRYYIFDLKDTMDQGAYRVYFKMSTDTNTYNTGYTDLFFVDQHGDTLNLNGSWSYSLPEASNSFKDTIEYMLYYRPGITSFPTDFNGFLMARNPDCDIPFQYMPPLATSSSAKRTVPPRFDPNPAGDKIRIDARTVQSIDRIDLFDLYGRKLFSQFAPFDEIGIASLSSGTYLLMYISEDQEVSIQKLVKK